MFQGNTFARAEAEIFQSPAHILCARELELEKQETSQQKYRIGRGEPLKSKLVRISCFETTRLQSRATPLLSVSIDETMDDWEDLEPDGTESNDEPIIDHVKPDDGAQESVEVSDDEIRGSDAPVCRICFGGAEEQDLGVSSSSTGQGGSSETCLQRLISPCLCRGSVAKVHVQCLNTWRSVSRGSTSFFQCDQCKYKYRLKRARIAGLAENRCERNPPRVTAADMRTRCTDGFGWDFLSVSGVR